MFRNLIGAIAPAFALSLLAASPTAVDAPPTLGVAEAHAESYEDSAEACVSFEIEELDRGLEYSASNSCERKLSCSMSWRLVCKTHKGKVQSTSDHSKPFALKSEGEASITASATSCKQNYKIENVKWACK